MNKHFSVVSTKSAVFCSGLTAFNIILFSICLVLVLTGGSKLWIIPVVIFVILTMICIMILMSVLIAGVDIKDDMVILPDEDPKNGKVPKFNIHELKSIELHNSDGPISPEDDSLTGARVVFILSNGKHEQYYPVGITMNQYYKLKDGMMALI